MEITLKQKTNKNRETGRMMTCKEIEKKIDRCKQQSKNIMSELSQNLTKLKYSEKC